MNKLIFESNDGNYVAQLDDQTYFSFNPCPWADIPFFEADGGGTETAMVLDGKFYILNGDRREQYATAFKAGGMEACCRLFIENEDEHGSTWTTAGNPLEWFLQRLKDCGV